MKLTLLKEFFAGFLRTRHFSRHFRRLALLDSLTDATVSREVPPTLAQTLVAGANSDARALLEKLGSHNEGLSDSEAEALREQYGLNEVEHEQPLPWWIHLWHCYKNPFNLLLTLLAVISWLTEDMKAATVIFSMVVLSTLLRFWQEAKSNKAADALKAMVSNTATVMRRGASEEATPMFARFYGAAAAVQGASRIELPIKQLVPGDLIVLSAGDMIPADCRVLSAKDLFVSQAAMTGESMPVEKYARQQDAGTHNPLDLENILFMGTNVVSGAATAVILTTGNNTYFGALAQRVSATDRAPTSFQTGVNKVSWLLIRFMFVMAPLVLFINGFTKGDWTQALLFALSITVGLTPEMLPMIVTSTLAKGAVFLSRKKVIVKRLDAIQNFGAMDVLCTDKTGTLTQDKIFLARHVDVWGDESDDVLEMAYLNSYYQTGLKNLLDVAVLEHVEVHRELKVATAFQKVDEIPFDFTRRRMSVVVAEQDQAHVLICKGAVEEVLAVCKRVRHGDDDEALSAELLARIRQVTAAFNEEGLRVVGDVERMSDAELAVAVETTNVFAKLTPAHKERIVRMLKANGHVVGFMGDGINDAPALRTADIGISVDSAVDIAKEAADIILLEKSLMVLEEGVLEGRRTFANMLKYIKMTASSNFGNVFSVLVASAFIPFLPMLPMHLLVQNLLYDISQIAIPFDNVDEEMLKQPQCWQPGDVGRFMLFFGPISSIFDITTFALMWYVFDANTPDHQTLFQSGWFVVGLLTQTLIVHMIRTPKIPFLQSRAATPLMVMTFVIMAVGIFLPMGPLAHYFKLQALPSLYFAFLPVILLAYMGLTQAVKGFYIRRFGWQ